MQDSQQGPENGLDLLGGVAVAGEVRSEWAARGKGMGVGMEGARWPAGPRGLSPSPQA